MERSKEFGSFFADASGGEGDRCNYPTRLDTYGCGCAHNCRYCYAKSLLDFRKNWHPDKPHVASTVDISKALKKVKRGQILRLGGMFLRVNGFIARWLEAEGYSTSHYTQKSGGYRHLPLWKKQALIQPFIDAGFELTVCEDVPAHYDYWRENLNANPDDCCNLRKESK